MDGQHERNVRGCIQRSGREKTGILLIDEIDSLGAQLGRFQSEWSPVAAVVSYNNSRYSVDADASIHRNTLRDLVLMAATNLIGGLDPALIREGRFDAPDSRRMPDEPTRKRIFEAQLSSKPWKPFALDQFARRTPGASAAKIKSIVDRAASFAASQNRKIEESDLRRALEGNGRARTGHCFSRSNGPDLDCRAGAGAGSTKPRQAS